MLGSPRCANVDAACRDLNARTLAQIDGDFARLVYLGSLRDYNTGEYHHDGLAWQFSEKVAQNAMAWCHWTVYRRLILCSVSDLVRELETYAASIPLSRSDFIRTWSCLQPYRVVIPRESTPITSYFFSSNVRAALAVLHSRQGADPQCPQSA